MSRIKPIQLSRLTVDELLFLLESAEQKVAHAGSTATLEELRTAIGTAQAAAHRLAAEHRLGSGAQPSTESLH